MPTALLDADGVRPTDDAIRAVYHTGRTLEDDDEANIHNSCYTAHGATHYRLSEEERQLDSAYALAKECETVAPPRVVDGPRVGTGFRSDGSRVDVAEPCSDDELDMCPDFDEEQNHNLNNVSLEVLQQPTCRARSGAASMFTCWQCGSNPGHEFQAPDEVFETAWRSSQEDDMGRSAVSAVKEMAMLLRKGHGDTVAGRCCVCNNIDCMLRAGIMTPEWRAEWLDGTRRPQEERETSRKNQVVRIERNMRLLHNLVKGGVLDLLDVRQLLMFFARNSQFVHEREKKFIATAMAVAENSHLFGFRFPQPQRFVDRMAAFAHGYVTNVLVSHVFDVALSDAAWEGHLQKLLDTALPKAPDAVFALMVEANAEASGFERDPPEAEGVWATVVSQTGRMIHRTSLEVFSPITFYNRLSQCVTASPAYELSFESSKNCNGSNAYAALATANKGKFRNYELQLAMQALQGAQREIAHGVAELPSSSDLQRETNVHPRLRYKNLFLALGYSDDDAEMRIALLLDHRTTFRSGRVSKPFYVLRLPTTALPSTVPTAGGKTILRRAMATSASLIPLRGRQWEAENAQRNAVMADAVTTLLEALRLTYPLPVINLAQHRLEASKAFSLILVSPTERTSEIEKTAWSLWWVAWSERRPSDRVSQETRSLVRSLNDSNSMLNAAASQRDVAQLFACISSIRDAATGTSPAETHPVVQHLVCFFDSIGVVVTGFLHAYRRSVKADATRVHARSAHLVPRSGMAPERAWASQRGRLAERGEFVDPRDRDKQEFVERLRASTNEELEHRCLQLSDSRQELRTARERHTNDLKREQRLESLKGTTRTRRRIRKPVLKQAPHTDADARLDAAVAAAEQRCARRCALLDRFALGEQIDSLEGEFLHAMQTKYRF